MAKRSKKRCEELPILHPHAAGVDVSASELFVAVSADRDPQPVRSFPTFTRDLNALADWLQRCAIRSVAMGSTSVYWIPVYQILEPHPVPWCRGSPDSCGLPRNFLSKPLKGMAGTTRLELATSAVTGQRSNQLNYVPGFATGQQTGGQCRTRTCDLLLVRQAL